LAISWQSVDLWDNLNPAQKQRIYERQSQEVVKFLSGMLLQEIREDMVPERTGLS
jgi:hypothetical protein